MKKLFSKYIDFPETQRPPKVMIGATLATSRFWEGALMSQWAEKWVDYWSGGASRYVTTACEDAGVMRALTSLAKGGKVDINRVLILRTASDFDQPPIGETPAQSLATKDSPDHLAGYLPAWNPLFVSVETLVEARQRTFPSDRVGHASQVGLCPRSATTTAVAVPLSTLVPMKHVFLELSRGRLPFYFWVVEFLDRQRLTGETTLGHEDVFGGQQPYVARNHVSGRQRDDVARYQIPQRDLSCSAVPNHGSGYVDHGLELLRAESARASCQKRSPTLSATIPTITEPARTSPVKKEMADKHESRITSGFRMIFRIRTNQPCFRSAPSHSGRHCARVLPHPFGSSHSAKFAGLAATVRRPSGRHRGRQAKPEYSDSLAWPGSAPRSGEPVARRYETLQFQPR